MSVAEFVRRRSRGAQGWLLLVGAGLLWLVLRRVAWIDLRHALAALLPLRLIPLLAINGLILLAFNVRWWLFLRAQGYSPPFVALLRYRLAAFGVSYFTPGPHTGGEPLQILLVQRKHSVPADAALAAVALDKIFDLFFNFLFLLISLTLALRNALFTNHLGPGSLLSLLLWPVLLVGALAAYRRGLYPIGGALRWGAARVQHLPFLKMVPTSGRTASLWSATQSGVLRSEARMVALCQTSGTLLANAVLISLGTWALLIAEFWLATAALALDLSLKEAVLALAAMRVAILLPLPAGLGALEASLVLAMQSLGMGASAGLALSVLIRVRDVGLGLWGLWLAAHDWKRSPSR